MGSREHSASRIRKYARRGDLSKLRRAWKRARDDSDGEPEADLLSAAGKHGRTAMHLAAEDGHSDVVDWLLRHGARADAVDDASGETPAHLAAKWAALRPELIVAFRAHAPSSLHVADAAGRTPRDVAAAVLAHASAKADAARRRANVVDDTAAKAAAHAAAEQAAQREQDWRSRLFDEAELDEGDGRDGWDTADAYGAYEEDHDAGDAPRRPTRAGDKPQTRRGRERERTPVGDARESTPERGDRPPGNVFEDWKRERQRERQAASERILEEERAKDAAWRQRVAAGSTLQQQCSAYAASWQAIKTTDAEQLRATDIPWPVPAGREAEVLDLVLVGVPQDKHRSVLRAELKRWHPDRFGARFGAALQAAGPAAERAAWARVNALSNALSEGYQKTT